MERRSHASPQARVPVTARSQVHAAHAITVAPSSQVGCVRWPAAIG